MSGKPTETVPGRIGIERDAAHWLARRDGSAWTVADDAELALWLDADTAHRVAFLRLDAAWAESGRLQALGAGAAPGSVPPRGFSLAPAAGRAMAMVPAPGTRAHRRPIAARGWFTRIAAVAALAVVFVLATTWGWRGQWAAPAVTYRTAVGQVHTENLPDGSQATLDSDTTIVVRMTGQRRDIALTRGQAMFMVAKDPLRPFVVDADGYRAVAVGTRYAVRRGAGDLQVVVTQGTVRLESGSADGAHPSALLPAGSVAQVTGNGVLVRHPGLDDARDLLEWRHGLLSFHDTPLREAVAAFNRYNTRPLRIADAATGALPISGHFRWDNEEGFVRLVQTGFGLRVEQTAEGITLHTR
ncbi:MAG: FecR domain-containing protein [Proteobacteria bacterium]|nr:FecR domain-containing protein [Pseudomonadota bacterium]